MKKLKGELPGKVRGHFVNDKRWAILPGAITKWYQRHKLWDKMLDVREYTDGLTFVVKFDHAKHTWRYNDKKKVARRGAIKGTSCYELLIQNV